MKITQKKPSQIKVAPYNPATRTTRKSLSSLLRSIEQHGIIYPLMVDPKGNLIDGHRRLACAKLLKLKEIPVIENNSKMNRDEAFEAVNTTSRKITNNDMCFMFINGGKVPEKIVKQIKEIDRLVGTKNLNKIGESYTTYKVLDYGKMIQRYCGQQKNPDFLPKAIMWLVDKKMIFTVRRAMESRTPKRLILNAVNRNYALKTIYK